MSDQISLSEAADEILRTSRGMAQEQFFFIVGAGVSYPSIETSPMLVDRFISSYNEDRMRFDLPEVTPPSDDPIDLYSFWFAKAFPQPVMRRDFLRAQMKGKAATPAVLRLAHLLTSHKLCSLVVTPNFDDLLYQSLLLFGNYPVLCDHPATVSRIELDNKSDVQVVHVHGTYNFYDCCNLRAEITERSGIALRQHASMPGFLDQILRHRSPIVLGYAGWDGDVIMTALRHRLQERPASYVYWFCHSRAAFEAVPDWLKANEYVRFVVPQNLSNDNRQARDSEGPLGIVVADDDTSHRHDRLEMVPTLDAVEVMDFLNERLEVEEPLLTLDPFEFLARRLDPILQVPGTLQLRLRAIDHYDFSSVAKRLRVAADHERRDRKDSEKALEQIRNLIRRSRYKRAASVAATSALLVISIAEGGDIEPLRELFTLFDQAVIGGEIGSDNELVQTLDKVRSKLVEVSSNATDKVIVAESILVTAKRFTIAKKNGESLPLIERALALLESVNTTRSAVIKTDAMLGKGMNLLALDPTDPAGYDCFDEVVRAKPQDGDEAHLIAHAFLHKAEFLDKSKNEAALDCYADMVKRFSKNDTVRTDVVRAILQGARAANRYKRFDKTLKFCRVAETLLASARNPAEKVRLKEAFIPKGVALRELGRNDDALSAFENYVMLDQGEKRYARVLPQLNGMMFMARLYAVKKNDPQKARDYFALAISSFGSIDDDHVRRHLDQARDELARLSEGKPVSANESDEV